MGLISRMYKATLIHRYDGEPHIRYFTAEDFQGLLAEPVEFDSDGNMLRGFFYSYPEARQDTLLVFCHGIGGGHRSYLTEIATLCRAGFPVFAYDNTGCFASEGESIRSMSRSLADLDNAVGFLKKEGVFDRYQNVYVLGHSWGGFAAGCIPFYREEIRKTVVISGFVSVKGILKTGLEEKKLPFLGAILKRTMAIEAKADPTHRDASILAAMEKGTCRYFIAHSEDDPIVPYPENAAILKERFPEEEYHILNGRKHNPHYTDDAVQYMNDTFGTYGRLVKEKKLRTEEEKEAYFADADWHRMTAQDPAFWEKVIAFLNSGT